MVFPVPVSSHSRSQQSTISKRRSRLITVKSLIISILYEMHTFKHYDCLIMLNNQKLDSPPKFKTYLKKDFNDLLDPVK